MCEYPERSLEIKRELGDRKGEATSLNNLGRIARWKGEFDPAREYLDQALNLFEGIGSEFGIARGRLATGRLALARGEADLARERASEARNTFEELGAPHWVGRSRHLLGQVAAAADAPADAREHWRTALDIFETLTTPQDALATLEELVDTCREQGDKERAREWCQQAQAVVADAPDSTAAQHRNWIERHAAELQV